MVGTSSLFSVSPPGNPVGCIRLLPLVVVLSSRVVTFGGDAVVVVADFFFGRLVDMSDSVLRVVCVCVFLLLPFSFSAA